MSIGTTYSTRPNLPSFPTRRSSDLEEIPLADLDPLLEGVQQDVGAGAAHRFGVEIRSEEHTSELQSHVNLVCRLLLEIKNEILLLGVYISHRTYMNMLHRYLKRVHR